MGSPAQSDERPQHRVRITKPFYLGKYPVTQDQWEAVMGYNPSRFKGPENPVESVSCEECQRFLGKLNRLQGNQAQKVPVAYRGAVGICLPGGEQGRYCFGDEEARLDEYAWYDANSECKPHPVGQKKPNAWGLYDMHGNTWQWCEDWYGAKYYAASPADDPIGPDSGKYRVLRGGSGISSSYFARSANRIGISSNGRSYGAGFRVARTP